MIIEYLPSILTFTLIQVLGVMSPGPDFAVVVRNSLIYSRKTALYTTIGLTLGNIVHLSYILLGLGVIIAETPWLLTLFKYAGGAYLFYIGIKGILAKKQKTNFNETQTGKDISALSAMRMGFITNAMNPKAMLFFLSLISAFITPKEPTVIIIIYVAIVFISTIVWFATLAFCFSNARLRSFCKNFQYIIERITGGLLILLGLKIILND